MSNYTKQLFSKDITDYIEDHYDGFTAEEEGEIIDEHTDLERVYQISTREIDDFIGYLRATYNGDSDHLRDRATGTASSIVLSNFDTVAEYEHTTENKQELQRKAIEHAQAQIDEMYF